MARRKGDGLNLRPENLRRTREGLPQTCHQFRQSRQHIWRSGSVCGKAVSVFRRRVSKCSKPVSVCGGLEGIAAKLSVIAADPARLEPDPPWFWTFLTGFAANLSGFGMALPGFLSVLPWSALAMSEFFPALPWFSARPCRVSTALAAAAESDARFPPNHRAVCETAPPMRAGWTTYGVLNGGRESFIPRWRVEVEKPNRDRKRIRKKY